MKNTSLSFKVKSYDRTTIPEKEAAGVVTYQPSVCQESEQYRSNVMSFW